MYQVDHTKSEIENFLGLINQGVRYPLKVEEFTRGGILNIQPNAGNNFSDTRVLLNATNPVVPMERTQVIYARIALAKNRPSAGFTIFCDNTDTHATIQAKIIERHRLVASEVEFVNAIRVPEAGESLNYTVNAKAGSYLYTGSMTILARNTDAVLRDQVHPSYFLGNPVGTADGVTVYAAPLPMARGDFNRTKTGQQVFLDFLNRVKTRTAPNDEQFTLENSDVTSLSNSSSSTSVVKVMPKTGSFVTQGFAVQYTNVTLANRQFSGAPSELLAATHVPTILEMVREFLQLSDDEVKLLGLFDAPENNTTYRKLIAYSAEAATVGRVGNGYTTPTVTNYFQING